MIIQNVCVEVEHDEEGVKGDCLGHEIRAVP